MRRNSLHIRFKIVIEKVKTASLYANLPILARPKEFESPTFRLGDTEGYDNDIPYNT